MTEKLFQWAGGKGKLIPHYSFPRSYNEYVEPFFGGGAVFWHLQPVHSKINDINEEIILLYKLVRDNPDFLISECSKYELEWLSSNEEDRKKYYYRLRKEYWLYDTLSTEAISLLYFLMKTSFNGVWQLCKESNGRFGTPVGLTNKKGRVINPELILQHSRMLENADITCGQYDAINVNPKSFVFCDPPYRDSFADYGTGFSDDDHIRLIEWCRRHAANGSEVWLCNRDSGDGFFEEHASDSIIKKIPITYTAGRRKKTDDGFEAKKATEILMIFGG